MKFNEVYSINVNEFTEKKGNLTYLSWAMAWKEFMRVYPNATYTVQKGENGMCAFGNSEMGYMVYTTVTADDKTHEMWLPVMDYKNKSIMKPSTFDINKAVMRCLAKNLAMFGLGLYIYAGEDLPESEDDRNEKAENEKLSKEFVTKVQEKALSSAIEKNEINLEKFLAYFKIDTLGEMTKGQLEDANKMIQKKGGK